VAVWGITSGDDRIAGNDHRHEVQVVVDGGEGGGSATLDLHAVIGGADRPRGEDWA